MPPDDLLGDLHRLKRLSNLLDSRYRVPGTTWRFGLDGIVGLIPGIGDTASALVSLYIVAEAWRLGVRKRTIARMLGNVALDSLIGAVPVAGDLFDFIWKSNAKNLRLAERDLERLSVSGRRT
ncbi:MAG: hypothetical protein K0Q70_243 [Rhodospirillales bacterium]|nr:hypothetical protein [Rhodospirillales bacterium]